MYNVTKAPGFSMLPEKHGENYYYHYHVNGNKGNPHIWFY